MSPSPDVDLRIIVVVVSQHRSSICASPLGHIRDMRSDSETSTSTPTTLLDILSNSLVLRQTAPYLSTAANFALAATSKDFQSLVLRSPDALRYLDLSTVQSATIPYVPLDPGGVRWRSERMDEALTEDEFYSGPLRGIFSKLTGQNILLHVYTLILDGLSVPADLVREIVAEDRFNVRILSLRECRNLNERKLTQLLKYAVRPNRPAGTPRLKAMYIFGEKDQVSAVQLATNRIRARVMPFRGVISAYGAQIGAEWNHRSREMLSDTLSADGDRWYRPSGRMMRRTPMPEWVETLQACEGLIAFDAVLCRGTRHDPSSGGSDSPLTSTKYLPPAIATVALGPRGCASCHSCPEGPSYFGSSPPPHLPLLAPPPLHSSALRAAQIPHVVDKSSFPPPLIVRCADCLVGRWCERCNIWWCETCYVVSPAGSRTTLQQVELGQQIHEQAVEPSSLADPSLKVAMGLCIETCLVPEMMAGAGSAGMWG